MICLCLVVVVVVGVADCRRQRCCYCGFAEAGQGGRPFFRSGGAWLEAEGSRCGGRCGARGRGCGWGVYCGVGVQGVCSCRCSCRCGCSKSTCTFQLSPGFGASVAILVWRRAGATHASMYDPPEIRDTQGEIRCTLLLLLRERCSNVIPKAECRRRKEMHRQQTACARGDR